ncbi:MAG: sulfurtransferase [Salinisphaera sp.]|jgi:thiosulfate/3-mercaptopyruvate sulfurtransferase|nr:sulfurtransferase [Salinisphaera sp.]
MLSPLIDVATLADWLAQEQPLAILDARARLDDRDAGRMLWRHSHITGAQHADMDSQLSAPPTPTGGRHPLPGKDVFADQLRAWGIRPDHQVVVYDDTGGRMAAARAWWMLHWAGHRAVFVLDGGWPAWQAVGQSTETAVQSASPDASQWQPQYNDDLIADMDDVATGSAVLLDARAAERFSGAYEPLDAAAGHIPGACNVPGQTVLDDQQRFLERRALDRCLPEATDIIAYCGSGISACQLILAYAVAGRPWPRLYPGSWSAWSQDTDRPVATGRA